MLSHAPAQVVLGAAVLALTAASCDLGRTGSDAATARDRPRETLLMWTSHAGRYDIAVLDADGPEESPRTITPSLEGEASPALFDRPVWSPDGSQIAFTVEHDGDASAPFATDVVVAYADGSDPRRLTDSRRGGAPVWSPDGRTIAFTQRTTEAPRSAADLVAATIWTVDADGGEPRELVPGADGVGDVPGSWSPDGRLLAFTRTTLVDPETFELDIDAWVVGADGSGLRKLIDDASAPAWSPDGTRIAFVSERDGNGELNYGDLLHVANELYVADADGSNPRRLTETRDVNEGTPAWSPDGTRIAFTQGVQTGNAEEPSVALVAAEGGCVTTLADGAWYANPAWRPGGARTRFEPRCTKTP